MNRKDKNTPDLTQEFLGPMNQPNYQAPRVQADATVFVDSKKEKREKKRKEKEERRAKKQAEKEKSRVLLNQNNQVNQAQQFVQNENESSFNMQDQNNDSNDSNESKPVLSDDEKKFRNKQRSKFIIRIVLIVLNIALIAYLIFEIVLLVRSIIDEKKSDESSYITLCGKSKGESQKIFDKYNESEITTDINDYAIVGNKLILSKYTLKSDYKTGFNNLAINNVCAGSGYEIIGDGFIDLNSLEYGDYLVFPAYSKEGKNSLGRFNSIKSIAETIYTMPNDKMLRKKITFKSNRATEGLVINVQNVTSLPNDYYDVVIYIEGDDKKEVKLDSKYKVKTCSSTKRDYSCVYNTRATFAVTIGNSNISPSYLLSNIEGFTKSTLNERDLEANTFIREISGYLTSAGSCYDEDSCIVKPYVTSSHIGKLSFVVNDDNELSKNIEKILKI